MAKTLTDSIWTELRTVKQVQEAKDAKDSSTEKKKIAISTIRRNLQREYFKRLAGLVLGPRNDFSDMFYFFLFDFEQPAPADARALARQHLKIIDQRIAATLKDKETVQLDSYSRAHLDQLHDQILKVLAAPLKMNEP